MSSVSFNNVLNKIRTNSFSNRQQGFIFEELMKSYLLSDPRYEGRFQQIWLWNEFPYKQDFGTGKDVGIDLVAQTIDNEYWAIQCKCYDKDSYIDKKSVDSFLSTSSKKFHGYKFSLRLWISTTNHWNSEAEKIINNQIIPVHRLSLADLEESAVEWNKLIEGKKGKQAQTKPHSLRDHQLKP